MLVIRAEQMIALGASVRRRFEREMADHLSAFFPEQCAALRNDELSMFIQTTIDRALGYGIDRERDVCKFLDVAMAIGKDFDRSDEYPWSREILADEMLVGQEKIDRLVQEALRVSTGASPLHD
jgi:hypothetical protein